jgi:hypothetical protein
MSAAMSQYMSRLRKLTVSMSYFSYSLVVGSHAAAAYPDPLPQDFGRPRRARDSRLPELLKPELRISIRLS